MLGPLAKEHLKMTYHQTLNIPITLGRRPTSGNTRRTFKGATGTAKQGENKDIAKTLHQSCFPDMRPFTKLMYIYLFERM